MVLILHHVFCEVSICAIEHRDGTASHQRLPTCFFFFWSVLMVLVLAFASSLMLCRACARNVCLFVHFCPTLVLAFEMRPLIACFSAIAGDYLLTCCLCTPHTTSQSNRSWTTFCHEDYCTYGNSKLIAFNCDSLAVDMRFKMGSSFGLNVVHKDTKSYGLS